MRHAVASAVCSRRDELQPLVVDPHQVGVSTGAQGGLHHRPVLRVRVEVTDVTAPTRPHEPRRSQLAQQLSAANEGVNTEQTRDV